MLLPRQQIPTIPKEWIVKTCCLLLGTVVAYGTYSALQPKIDWNQFQPPKRIKLSFGGKATQTKPTAPVAKAQLPFSAKLPAAQQTPPTKIPPAPAAQDNTAAIIPIPTKTLESKTVDTTGKHTSQRLVNNTTMTQQASEPQAAVPSVEEVTVMAQATQFGGQQGIDMPVVNPQLLPEIAGSGTPPTPGEVDGTETPTQYPETPGGNILVMEVFVDETGTVVDSKTAVSTFDPLADVTLTWAIRGQKFKQIDPPIKPGEIRKLVLRFPYLSDQAQKFPQLP